MNDIVGPPEQGVKTPPETSQTTEKDATIAALVAWMEREHKEPLPTIPIGARVRVRNMGIATVVGRDGVGFDGLAVLFDAPAPRGFEDGCCTGPDECEILSVPLGSAGV